jgi:D-beta-D-heptose 7-phosphate kinase/D-beta-D-heptose 1-phosphate adenosyltransferase
MFNNFEQISGFLNNGVDRCKILVFGDVMLDQYHHGDVGRISPEAPVPVIRVTESRVTLGGAANVANNLAHLGCQVFLAGVAGQDENKRNLCSLLDVSGIDYAGLISINRPTTTKVRVIGAHQQMIRLDFEEAGPVDGPTEEKLKWSFSQTLGKGIDAVIISDYAKGICTFSLCQFIIDECQKRNIQIIVDPKGLGWNKYVGASFITPNVKELGQAIGEPVANEDSALEQCAMLALKQYQLGNIVVTRSEKGLSLIAPNHRVHIPTRAKEVFDVSGAGDTVTAVLAAAVAGGLDYSDAALISNLAAGIVVGKVGTYAVSKIELIDSVWDAKGGPRWNRKVMQLHDALTAIKKWRSDGDVIVFTNGCFDILHSGHVTFLETAKQFGDRLVVGLNTDASVQRLKGPERPITSEQDRAKMLAAFECVDCVIFFDEDLPTNLIRAVIPDVVETVMGREFAGRVEIIPLEEGYSTTGIVEKVLGQFSRQEKNGL